jgi:serine/threonine-protein kinase SRPK3
MHRTRLHKVITTKFKCLVETIRRLTSTVGDRGEGDRGDDDNGPQDSRRRIVRRRQVIPCTSISLGVDVHESAPTATGISLAAPPTSGTSGTATPFQQVLRTTEVYLPGYLWDALNPTERYASVADLCAHIGDQLPIQVVKLIARDVLRALQDLHSGPGGVAHNSERF